MPGDRGLHFLHAARERSPLGELAVVPLTPLRFFHCTPARSPTGTSFEIKRFSEFFLDSCIPFECKRHPRVPPAKDRLQIYRRACVGSVGRCPRYEPLGRAPFTPRAQGTDDLSSSPAAGLTCGDYLRTHVVSRFKCSPPPLRVPTGPRGHAAPEALAVHQLYSVPNLLFCHY